MEYSLTILLWLSCRRRRRTATVRFEAKRQSVSARSLVHGIGGRKLWPRQPSATSAVLQAGRLQNRAFHVYFSSANLKESSNNSGLKYSCKSDDNTLQTRKRNQVGWWCGWPFLLKATNRRKRNVRKQGIRQTAEAQAHKEKFSTSHKVATNMRRAGPLKKMHTMPEDRQPKSLCSLRTFGQAQTLLLLL